MADQDPKEPKVDVESQVTEDDRAAQNDASPQADTVSNNAADEAADADSVEGEDNSLAQLEEELALMKDAALRAQADAQNVKRRAEMDVEKARKFALEGFSKDLLPVVDNLERALEAATGDHEQAMAEGVELTLKNLLDVLSKYHIEQIDPQGEPFDPQLHQAMSMVENPEVEPNTVIAVMQKGYSLNGRLLRPAMVMVSKAAEPA